MAVTIREVAKAAGVSTAAVSKVLHGRGASVRVSEERAKIIREVAAQLEYRPNALARNLRSSRTHTVGLIFENFWNISGGPLYYLHLLDGIASPLFNRHYRLTILPELAHDDILGSLGDGQLEGVVWCKLNGDDRTRLLIQQSPIPIVALSAPPPDLPDDVVFVACDNQGGIELAVDHLWELGHRRIMFLCEVEEQSTPDCVSRRRAFFESLRSRGVAEPERDAVAWSWHFEEFAPWWSRRPQHTAIICWSESAAARLLEQATRAGVNLPTELSIVGFDSTQFCDTTRPRLTAIRQPIFEIARYASESLLRIIAGDAPSPVGQMSRTFPCELDVRDSTSAPRPSTFP